MNTSFLEHFGKWRGNTGFVIFMTPPSGEVICAHHDPLNCFIKECRADNTSCLREGRAEVWMLDGSGGPFFCEVKHVFLTRAEAEARLVEIANCEMRGLQMKIDALKDTQQQLMELLKKGF